MRRRRKQNFEPTKPKTSLKKLSAQFYLRPSLIYVQIQIETLLIEEHLEAQRELVAQHGV